MSSPLIPSDNSLYNSVDYWDKRYRNCGQSESQSYDWLVDYSNVKHIIEKCVPKSASILMLGCGNSLLSEEMFADGYHRIHNIDYSAPVIQNMSEHCDSCRGMKWSVMDCMDLKFGDECFDVVIEKATIDALLSEEKSVWDVSQNGIRIVSTILNEVNRVLVDSGQFISISFFGPHLRHRLYKTCLDSCHHMLPINRPLLRMKAIHELSTNFHYYCYQLIKSADKTIELMANVYEPPKIISGFDINQCDQTIDNRQTTDEDEDESYLFDIRL